MCQYNKLIFDSLIQLTSWPDTESEGGAVAASGVVGSTGVHPSIINLNTAQLKDGPVSYTHLTLPTNREV